MEMFVERVPVAPVLGLAAAKRLLVIDACTQQLRVAELLGLLANRAPVSPSYVRVPELGEGAEYLASDLIWMLVDKGSDFDFCELLLEDLSMRIGSLGWLVAVGEVERESVAGRFEPAQLGAGRPWSRRRDLGDGVEVALGLLSEMEAAG